MEDFIGPFRLQNHPLTLTPSQIFSLKQKVSFIIWGQIYLTSLNQPRISLILMSLLACSCSHYFCVDRILALTQGFHHLRSFGCK